MGRLDFATLPGSATPVDFTPLADDTLARITRPSGATAGYTYFAQGPIESITVKAAGTTQLQRLAYAVDAVQNITNLSEQHASSDPTGAYVYGYDAANRLTSASYPTAVRPSGQPGLRLRPGRQPRGPGRREPLRLRRQQPPHREPGDPLLHVRRRRQPDGKDGGDVGYDFTNRLRSFSNSTNAASYAYDPFGRRIRKSVNGVTTWYLWDGDQLLAEYDGSGARTVRYAYAGGFAPMQVAYKDGAGEDVYDVHSDHLDTPRLLTDSAGTAVWREAHEAFGKAVLDPANTVTFNVRFPGQYFDAESGLHDNRFRTYDPGTGPYISADPIGQSGGVNVNQYASANPVNRFDPLGLEVTMVCRLLGGAMGKTGKKHCSVFVWHADECGDKMIDRQYTLEFGGRTPLPQDITNNKTFDDDREAFGKPGGSSEYHQIAPPDGFTTVEHDRMTITAGDGYSQGPYDPIFGPNSNTAADNIVEGGGGVSPRVDNAPGKDFGE